MNPISFIEHYRVTNTPDLRAVYVRGEMTQGGRKAAAVAVDFEWFIDQPHGLVLAITNLTADTTHVREVSRELVHFALSDRMQEYGNGDVRVLGTPPGLRISFYNVYDAAWGSIYFPTAVPVADLMRQSNRLVPLDELGHKGLRPYSGGRP